MISLELEQRVARFLFDEAELLDQWQLTDWEALLTDDAEYLVPPVGALDAQSLSSDTTLFVIADDRALIAARVARLSGKTAYAEVPRSQIRHLVSNVRVLDAQPDAVAVSANFAIYRVRRGDITQYVGQYRYLLKPEGPGYKIRRKSVLLANDVLRGQGGLSFVL